MDFSKSFGCKVFDDSEMQKRLPPEVYQSLRRTNSESRPLDPQVAPVVAREMKNWAVEQGATHYTHWFQPMTNVTAGKHDSFLDVDRSGHAILEFSAKALVMGEPDASSFPSGGIRATFEARGYTAWDPTSPAFVREDTLYIPTAFCSYTGEALDQKTPLLRAMQALNRQALRVLRVFGSTATRVFPTVGAEQEYFLIDRTQYEQRLDLKLCGRTLFGQKPPKGQELDDHYCGRIRLRVADFMRDLDHELWMLGVPAKTKHNEAAPAQHELAVVFDTANIACDHNQLTMEVMRRVAKEHGLACLLHEKPFAGVNGSGKHNNFGLMTDAGQNLLDPGRHPWDNLQFLAFFCAVITAVYRFSDLLRLSAASPGNDHRLGGFEAPPAVISIYLGDRLTSMLYDIAEGVDPNRQSMQSLQMGVSTLPDLPKDSADRNRTSPFAFTGNRFEFRMVGAPQSVALPNVMLCTALADVLGEYATRLETASNFDTELRAIVRDTVHDCGTIIFNGNNYTPEWLEEARRRGLPVLSTSVEAFGAMTAEKNVALFERHGVFSRTECEARAEVLFENYNKVLCIEANTMLNMAKRQIFPACVEYAGRVAESCNAVRAASAAAGAMKAHLDELCELVELIRGDIAGLEKVLAVLAELTDEKEHAYAMQKAVLPAMHNLRQSCDRAESIVDAKLWPMPTYTDLLNRV